MYVKPRRRRATRPSVEPQATDKLMDSVFRWLKLDEPARSFRAQRAFAEAAGPRIRERARAERMRGSVLYVRVASSAWSHELHALKAQLVQKIRSVPGGEMVEDLRFVVAPLEEVAEWTPRPADVSPEFVGTSTMKSRPRFEDAIVRAMGEVGDDDLREQLTILYSRFAARR